MEDDPVLTRREILTSGAGVALGASAVLRGGAAAAQAAGAAAPSGAAEGAPRALLSVPNGSLLPWRMVDGVKVFHLVVNQFTRQFAPGLMVDCWGYNGETPGPVIEAVEGDRVRIYVTNQLPEPTSVHWHGILLPNGMDGVSGLNQPGIPVGETYVYEFPLKQHGTFMYHSHFDEMIQMAMGCMGMFVIHPRDAAVRPAVERDFCLMLSEWAIKPGARKPDPSVMTDFNILTINGKAFPGTAPLVAKVGDRVRIRIGNLSAMDHHPIHLHGYSFRITATDGGLIPPAGQWPETTVLVAVGSTRDIEFVADAPGDWAMHCHMTHHVMNQMGHDIPNMLGLRRGDLDEKMRSLLPGYMTMGQDGMGEMGDMGMPVPRNSIPMRGGKGPHGYIDMGGMFTVVKVREQLDSYADPGWYQQPADTAVRRATAAQLRADGIRTS
jgi:FtsP/CotA-like multicopper oxidase with cupredoxin domain